MNVTIETITDPHMWTQHFDRINSRSFMQSWAWGEMQERLGHGVVRLGLVRDGEVVGIGQVIKMRSKRGPLLFVPHGPLCVEDNPEWLRMFVEHCRYIAKKEGFWYIRFAPLDLDTPQNRQKYRSLGFRDAPLHLTTENSWVLSLAPSEDELMQAMRKTTRYSIRKASKDGAYVEWRDDEAAVEEFWMVNKQTVEREKYASFSKKFTLEELRAFVKERNASFIFGKVQGSNDIIAAALILFTKSSGFYHQGASVHSKIPVAYLVQWEAILEAKKRGCEVYNFWGIASSDDPSHPWSGLTLFKKGFGGYELKYVPEQDLVVSPKYWLTYFFEKRVRMKRGL